MNAKETLNVIIKHDVLSNEQFDALLTLPQSTIDALCEATRYYAEELEDEAGIGCGYRNAINRIIWPVVNAILEKKEGN